jgi:hypothetical protein
MATMPGQFGGTQPVSSVTAPRRSGTNRQRNGLTVQRALCGTPLRARAL